MGAPPGLILDDLYRVLGDRDPSSLRLVVEAVEHDAGITRVRYALRHTAGAAVTDAAGEAVVLVGGVPPDDPLPGIAPGAALAIPSKSDFGTELG